jgi:hypothetical protein
MSDDQQQSTAASDAQVEAKEIPTQGKLFTIIIPDIFINHFYYSFKQNRTPVNN